MRIEINLTKFKKMEDLNLDEYLILCVLNEDPDLELPNWSEKDIILSLEDKGYLREIESNIILDAKAVRLFESEHTTKAKEVLAHMNKLKKDLGISARPFNYKTHNKEINARLAEGIDIEIIKEMLTYKYNKWKGTEWQIYLRPSTLFNKNKFYNYIEEYEQKKSKISQTSSLYKMA